MPPSPKPGQPVPVSDFSSLQEFAVDVSGTVVLPSPYPASARLFLAFYPPPGGYAAWQASSEAVKKRAFILKAIQTVTDQHVVTYLVRPEDVRALRKRPVKDPLPPLSEWPIVSGQDLGVLYEAAVASLSDAKGKAIPDHPREVALIEEEAVLYVHESARVLLRLEYGMTASDCSLSTDDRGPHVYACPTCKCKPRPGRPLGPGPQPSSFAEAVPFDDIDARCVTCNCR